MRKPEDVYAPEMRAWALASKLRRGRTFDVFEAVKDKHDPTGLDEGRPGVRIFTVTVAPGMTAPSADRLAWFLRAAPQLWRAVRDLNRHNLRDESQVENFARYTLLLDEAAGREPYDEPPNLGDDDVFTAKSEAVIEAVAKMQRGGASGRLA